MNKIRFRNLIYFYVFSTQFCFAQETQKATRLWIKNQGIEILNDFRELLTIPNVAGDTGNINRNAEYIHRQFSQLGFSMRLLKVKHAAPIVFGERRVKGADRTVAIYVHYDGQPVNEAEWNHPPFEPVLYTNSIESGGKKIPFPKLGDAIDPEWRIYARSSGDDKAPLLALKAALDALESSQIKLTSNIKLFFEGEEEAGSTHLEEYLDQYADLLNDIDIWLFCDGPIHQSRRPQLVFGVRGVTGLELTVYGSTRPLHSGHYGNWAPVPGQDLSRLLTSMKAENGSVLIKGFYDSVEPLSPFERQALANIPNPDAALKHELGLQRTEGMGASLSERLLLPSLTVKGLLSGNVGDKARNIIPATATASLGIRLVKGNDPVGMLDLVEDHIRSQGWHIVRKDPDMTTRKTHPKIVKVIRRKGYPAARTSMELPRAQEVIRAVKKVAGNDLILMPGLGGSLPLYLFTDKLKKPVIILPLANHDNNQHAANENLRIANLWYGIDLLASILTMP